MKILLAINISLIFTILFFQNTYAQNFNGGPLGGFSVSQVDGDSLGGYNKAGFILGGFVTHEINKTLSIEFEFKYTQKGSKVKGNIEENYDYFEMRLNYIEIPIFIKYNYNDKISLEAGFAEAYLFNAKVDNDGYGFQEPENAYNKLETSILAGLNYQLTDHLFINGRFNYSLYRINDYALGNRLWMRYGQYNNIISFVLKYQL